MAGLERMAKFLSEMQSLLKMSVILQTDRQTDSGGGRNA
jgi:hypothetical protein